MEKYGVETLEVSGQVKQASEVYQIGNGKCPKCGGDISAKEGNVCTCTYCKTDIPAASVIYSHEKWPNS